MDREKKDMYLLIYSIKRLKRNQFCIYHPDIEQLLQFDIYFQLMLPPKLTKYLSKIFILVQIQVPSITILNYLFSCIELYLVDLILFISQ